MSEIKYKQMLPAIKRSPLGPVSHEMSARNFWMPPGFAVNFAFAIRRFLLRLADRVVPAELPLFEKSMGMMDSVLLSIAARLNIADALNDGPLTADELSRGHEIHAESLHRILRTLCNRGVFSLDSKGRFRNNRLSETLIQGGAGANREWVQYFGSQSNMLAWLNLPSTLNDGRPSFDDLFGMTVWDWFEKYPDEQEMFAHSMMGITKIQAPIIANSYPFSKLKTICDIGGGRGTLLSEILKRHVHLKGILLDAEGVIASAEAMLLSKGVRDRAELVAGNFLEHIPVADAYILKNIFHDWDDDFCKSILKTLKQTAISGQRVLIIENILESNWTTGIGPTSDAQMMVVCSGGRERSLREIQALLTDCGYSLGKVYHHPIVSIVEGIQP